MAREEVNLPTNCPSRKWEEDGCRLTSLARRHRTTRRTPTLHLSPQRIWKHWTVEWTLDRVARVRTHGAKDGRDWVRCGTFSAVVG